MSSSYLAVKYDSLRKYSCSLLEGDCHWSRNWICPDGISWKQLTFPFQRGLFKHARPGTRGRYGQAGGLPVFSVPHPVTSRVLANLLAFVSEQELDLEEEEVVDTLVQVKPSKMSSFNFFVQADFLDMKDAVEDCAEWVLLSKSKQPSRLLCPGSSRIVSVKRMLLDFGSLCSYIG